MDDAQYGQDKRSTIYDVAAAAGVSHMTVSRVLNGHPNIREATRERVLAAIEELGYRPNSIARALASKRAMSLGIIVDRPSQYGPRSTLLALERAARESGYSVHVYSLLGFADESEIARAVAEFDAAGLDAMCAIVRRYDAFEQLRATRSKLPTVLAADVADAEAGARSVAIDQRQVALTAMAHLGAYGHRRVLHLSGPLDTVDGRKREQGWREAAREYGDAEPRLVVGDWTSEVGYALGATGDLGECTAVFAANDQMALGLLHGLSTRGVRVPQDISVVGCDDQPEAAHLSPPLTTVRQDFSALGAAIISSALEAIDDPLGSATVRLPPELIVRDSTRRLTD